MKVRYNKKIDVAYIELEVQRKDSDVALTYTCDAQQIHSLINLEFDVSGKLLGLEVLDASSVLPSELIKGAIIKK